MCLQIDPDLERDEEHQTEQRLTEEHGHEAAAQDRDVEHGRARSAMPPPHVLRVRIQVRTFAVMRVIELGVQMHRLHEAG